MTEAPTQAAAAPHKRAPSPRAPNADHIRKVLRPDYNVAKLAATWGVGESTLHEWVASDDPPLWTLCAAEGLLRRSRNYRERELFLVHVEAEQAATLIKLCSAIGGKITGPIGIGE